MNDMRVVFDSRNRRACADRALVLASLQIPHQLVDDDAGCALVVPAEYSARALDELRLYDQENPPQRPRKLKTVVYQNAVPGVVHTLSLFARSPGLLASPILARTGWLLAGSTVSWFALASGGEPLPR